MSTTGRTRAKDDQGVIVAVDLGGTRFRVAALTSVGTMLARVAEPTRVEEGCDAILQRIYQAVRHVASACGEASPSAVGVAAPGPLNPWTGMIFDAPNMPGWNDVPLKALMERELGRPVFVGNDANVAALGEHRFGTGRGKSDLVYITASTGIGGGVISANKLLLGSNGLAGEIGHITVDPEGPPCGCGNRGCLEAIASGTAIARRARNLLAQGAPSLLRDMVGADANQVSAELVERAALAGDALAEGVMRRAAEALGIGVSSVVHLFNPQMVVIGGGVSNAGPLIFQPIWRVVRQRTMAAFRANLEIVPAKLGDDVGLLGCVALVLSEEGKARFPRSS